MTDVDAAGGDAPVEALRPAPTLRAGAPWSAELGELLPQLSVERSAIRCAAVNRLATAPHAPFVVEPLIALLKDERLEVRRAALWALAASGDTRAVLPLRAVMKGGGALAEDAGGALGRLQRRLAGRSDYYARNADAPQAIQTAQEIREAIAARKLRLRSEVRKGVRLKLAALPLWGAGVALFGIGVAVSGAGFAIAAGIAFGLLGLVAMEYADRYMPPDGLREYVTCCDPDLSQSWAVGIALGGGLDGGGGGLDG